MKVGDLVKRKVEARENEEHEIGIVIGFKQRGGGTDKPDPDCDVWNDAIVMWPTFGAAFHMRALLEVISESR